MNLHASPAGIFRSFSNSNLGHSFYPTLRRYAFLGLITAAVTAGLSSAAYTDLPVYTDSLQNNWQDWSWSSTRDFSSSVAVHSGSKSLAVTITGGWGALSLHHDNLDTSSFTNLSFWIHGGSSGGQLLALNAEANGALPGINLQPLTANAWQLVSVPLTSLNIANITNLNRITVQDRSGGGASTFYVDDMTLFGGPTPPSATTIPAAGATIRNLTGIEVDFSEAVTGVDASDLLINGSPATNVTAYADWQYVFEFSQPPTGTVQVAWSTLR